MRRRVTTKRMRSNGTPLCLTSKKRRGNTPSDKLYECWLGFSLLLFMYIRQFIF
jgi:hypothetical protein